MKIAIIALLTFACVSQLSAACTSPCVAAGACADNPFCTVVLNNTGATLLVAWISSFGTATNSSQITSVPANVWSCNTNTTGPNTWATNGTVCWVKNPSVSSTQSITFTTNVAMTLVVASFNGIAITQDKTAASGSGSSPLSSGSITPAASSLIIAAAGADSTSVGINTGGFTNAASTTGTGQQAGLWYQVNSSPVNPNFSAPGLSWGFVASVNSFAPPATANVPFVVY